MERTAYGRLQAIIHEDFLKRYVKSDDRILDAGSGPGRFSIALARLGARVTVFDLSNTQLTLARKAVEQAGLLGQIAAFLEGDICDLRSFPDASFDAVVCYGGALSYVCERSEDATRELVRVTRPDGILLISVMSRFGATANLIRVGRTVCSQPRRAKQKSGVF